MFGFLRNLTKSDKEKRQEYLAAYLDSSLSAEDRRRFEQRMEHDDALRADLEQQRIIKEAVSQLPRVRAPRSFTLDPSLYGRPSTQPGLRLYPALRVATALAMVVFIALVSIDVFVSETSSSSSITITDEVAQAAEKIAEEAGVSEGVAAEIEATVARSAVLDEPAAEAPAEAEAVEEDGELEVAEAVLESESITTPLQATGTIIAQEAAPAAEGMAEVREGETDFASPPEAEPAEAVEAGNGTLSAALSALQTLVATQEPDDQILGEVRETTEAEVLEGEAAPQPVVATPTQKEMPVPPPSMEEVIVASESTPVDLDEAGGDDQKEDDVVAPEAQRDVDDGPILGLGPIRLAEICLGLSVMFLILITLLLRRQVRRGS